MASELGDKVEPKLVSIFWHYDRIGLIVAGTTKTNQEVAFGTLGVGFIYTSFYLALNVTVISWIAAVIFFIVGFALSVIYKFYDTIIDQDKFIKSSKLANKEKHKNFIISLVVIAISMIFMCSAIVRYKANVYSHNLDNLYIIGCCFVPVYLAFSVYSRVKINILMLNR